MSWRKLIKSSWCFVVVVALLTSGSGLVAAEQPQPPFSVRARDLAQIEDLMQVGPDQRIAFDASAALERGYSIESIRLAEESVAFTNALVEAAIQRAKSAGADQVDFISIEGLDMDLDMYPALKAYFEDAAKSTPQVEDAVGAVPQAEEYVASPDRERLAARPIALAAATPQSVCGSIGNPVPSKAVASKTWGPYSSQSAAESQLKKWGYYRASWIPGGDWTRNQTYQSTYCKKDTFRDHAGVPYKSGSKWYFWEQNYTGTIPGEPNPVLSAWPGNWPYSTWPNYVYWWHRTY